MLRRFTVFTVAMAALSLGGLPSAQAKPCGDCGVEVADAARFCHACGKRSSPRKTCSECARPAEGEARFCAHCGHKFAYALEDEEHLVGTVVKSRKEYLDYLGQLSALYRELGFSDKAALVEEEIAAANRFMRVVPRARFAPDAPPPVQESIEEADRLYREAEELRKSPNLFRRKQYLRDALDLYQKVLLRFPASDKCDECAYRVAEIYASPFFESYERAVEYYELCVRINPKTDLDARFRAADLAEYRLRDEVRAVALYRIASEHDPVAANRETAKARLAKLQAVPPKDK